MDARRCFMLAGAAVLPTAAAVVLTGSCTAISGLDSKVFDVTDAGTDAAGGHTSWGSGGGGGRPPTGGSGGSAGAGGSRECEPGDTWEQGGCENCGTKVSICTWPGVWGEPICADAGVCSDAAVRQGDCQACTHQVCQDTCLWGECELKPTSECDQYGPATGHGGGMSWEWCYGGTTYWRWCLPGCVWASCQHKDAG